MELLAARRMVSRSPGRLHGSSDAARIGFRAGVLKGFMKAEALRRGSRKVATKGSRSLHGFYEDFGVGCLVFRELHG